MARLPAKTTCGKPFSLSLPAKSRLGQALGRDKVQNHIQNRFVIHNRQIEHELMLAVDLLHKVTKVLAA